jgi:hypothetical protein
MKTKLVRALCTSFVLAGILAGPALASALHRAEPIDQAALNTAFFDYRAALRDAVARRDVAYIIAQAASTIQLDFGGGKGREEFAARLTLSPEDLAPEYAHLAEALREGYWHALETVLRLGGEFQNPDLFTAPYTSSVVLDASADPGSTWFVIGRDVAMRAFGTSDAEIIGTLSYDIVTVETYEPHADYLVVTTAEGHIGYVAAADLWSATGYRATFERSGGTWQMTSFLAGD